MMEIGIKTLSDGEKEFGIIMERMKSLSEEITAEQAIQTISKARETKEGVIAEAEKQFDETVALAILMRDELGIIDQKKYADIVRGAEKQRIDVISNADEMYQGVLDIAREKGGEHLTQTEIALGKQLSVWDEWSIGVTGAAAKTYAKVVVDSQNMAVDAMVWIATFKKNAVNNFADFGVGVGVALKVVPAYFENMKEESMQKLVTFTVAAYNVGGDIVLGLINGIKSKIVDVGIAAHDIGATALKSLSKVLRRNSPSKETEDIGVDFDKGLIIGMESETGNVVKTASATGQKMVDAALKTISAGTKATNAEIASINKKARDEEKKIEERAEQDIYLIKKKAKDEKRKLTASEVVRIERIEEDSATKVKKIHEKASSDISKVQANANSEKLDELKQFIESKKQTEELSLIDEANIWRRAAATFEEGTKEKIAAQKEYKNALEQINKEITSINETYVDKMQDINDKLKANEQELIKVYEDAFQAKQASYVSAVGLFDKMDTDIEKSGAELLENLNSQVEGFKLWQQQIELLAGKDINEGLMSELKEMGPKALPELLALNSMTAEQLALYSSLYQEEAALARSQAEAELAPLKENTAKQIQELRIVANQELSILQTEWTNKIKSVTQATSEEFKTLTQIGVAAGQNLLDGLKSMQPALVAQATEIARVINAALQSTLGGSVSVPAAGANSSSKNSKTSSTNTAKGSQIINLNFDASNLADMQKAITLLTGLVQANNAN